jgi:thiamin-phosphate kinase
MSFVPSHLGEFELIQRFFVRDTGPKSGVILGIGDDAALLNLPEGSDLVAAVDTIVAGRHFLEGTDARSIGHRALAVNLSDIAAMGATPLWATLALTLPSIDLEWLEKFAAGFMDLADLHAVALVGGDTTRGPLTISVQILGSVPHGTALRRSGGQAGDLLAVSGTLGDAAAGLSFLKAPQSSDCWHAGSRRRPWTCPTAWSGICPNSRWRAGSRPTFVSNDCPYPVPCAVPRVRRRVRLIWPWAEATTMNYCSPFLRSASLN